MSKRSLESDVIYKYTQLYKAMPQEKLADELNALSDQMLAFLLATNCSSIEVLYDGTHSLKCEFCELSFKRKQDEDYKQRMN